jgi:GntR family transcriptional regulator, transcriptional repressor for pyruvate dehydrogenase complex
MFDSVKATRTFEGIISQIEEAILSNELHAGDKLPSERHLTEIFKVSRGTLREALRSLEQKKLIKIKTGVGGGAIVRAVDSSHISENLDFLLRYQKITITELMEFREQVEGMIAAVATRKAGKEDILQLESLMNLMEDCLQYGIDKWDDVFVLDKKFHMTLSRATENRMFESVLSTVYDNINRYFESYLSKDSKILKNTYKELLSVLKAIKKGDAELARVSMKNHIRRYYRLMKKQERKSKIISAEARH